MSVVEVSEVKCRTSRCKTQEGKRESVRVAEMAETKSGRRY